jgi:hypothetical protein
MLFVLHSIERISSFFVPAFVTTTTDEGTRLTLYNYSNTLSLSVGFPFLSSTGVVVVRPIPTIERRVSFVVPFV